MTLLFFWDMVNFLLAFLIFFFFFTVSTNSKLSVFPNPAKGNVTIVLDNITDKSVEVMLINILGAEVSKLFSGTVVSKHQEISADLIGLEKGIYFVKVVNNSDVIMTDKLIVE